MRQKELSIWLKLIISFCGLFVLFFNIYIGLETGKIFMQSSESLKTLYTPFVTFIWITTIPFLIALFFGWSICSDISSDQSFSVKNAERLKLISILSMIEGILYAGGLFFIFKFETYSISILIILFLILFFAVIISIFTSMLSHLVRKASEIKQDNDLTI